jgi:prepilin-type N-terminal cleavage/methylation domain-containing protein
MSVKPMNKKGVTLIELVVVFVIIAIGAVLLVPNIGGWLRNYRLKTVTRDIVSTMRTAQMKAVSSNLEYRVSFANPNFWLERGNLNSDSTIWTTEGAVQTLPSGITMSGSLNGSNAHFNTNSTSSPGSLTLQNTKGTQRRITLTTATGRVKIID